MRDRVFVLFLLAASATAVPADAQFRRGLFAEAREIVLFPLEPPALLVPEGSVEVNVKNASTAPARILGRLQELLRRQIADNDSRLRPVDSGGDFIVTATLTEWSESRRTSRKYVSETRQVGTKQVTDKNGKTKTEPVYEYGSYKPSVVISGIAGMRIEVRHSAGAPIADERARHTMEEEHLSEAGPPSRDAVENTLADNVIRKAAGRISPGREPVRVPLARSDDVDDLNALAQSQRWQEWLTALERVKPNRDRKRDAYRLHNLAVAREALAYTAGSAEESRAQLAQAMTLIAQASQQHPDERYITDSRVRINKAARGYEHLASLYQQANAERPAATPASPAAPSAATKPGTAPMTNQDVLELLAAGLDDENLIAAIKAAKAVNFDLSPEGLRGLLAGKVSNRVIAAMRARTQS